MPRLSIIMPVYNSEKYLREAIESVLNQSFKDFELILVNDASTDSSREICEEYSRKESRVKTIELEKNQGPGLARNKAIEIAQGEYFTFVDSDDKISADTYSELIRFAGENRLDIVRCEMGRFSDKNPIPAHVFQYYGGYHIFKDKSDMRQMALCVFATPIRPEDRNLNFGGSACSALFHKSLFKEKGLRFPEREHMISEDYIFCYRALLLSDSIGLVPKSLYFYRENPKSRSNIPRQDIIRRALSTAELMSKMIADDGYPERDQIYAMQYVIEILRAFVKNYFLSDLPFSRIRRWFMAQHNFPILERVYREFPFQYLSRAHRIHFKAFYRKQFLLLYSLVHLREMKRKLLKK